MRILYSVVMYLLFDIGGTHLRIGWSKTGQRMDEAQKFATPQDFADLIKLLEQQVPAITQGNEIKKPVVGTAGAFDKEKTKIVTAPNLRDWEGKPLKKELERITGAPVELFNDAAVAGLAEATQGAGKGASIVAYLTISTGIGGVRIVDKKIDASAYGFEPGQHFIEAGKTWEQLASGGGLKTRYGKNPAELNDQKIWQEVTRYLAIGLHNITMLWSPEVIILGGALVLEDRIKIDELADELKKISHIFPELPALKKSQLGDQAGLLGALKLVVL